VILCSIWRAAIAFPRSASEKQNRCRTAEAGTGVQRVLLVHDGTPEGHDLFQSVLTMLDPQVSLTVVSIFTTDTTGATADFLAQARQQTEQVRRPIDMIVLDRDSEQELWRLVAEGDSIC